MKHYLTVDGQVGADGYVTTTLPVAPHGAVVTPVSPAHDPDYNPWEVLAGTVAPWDRDHPKQIRVRFFGTDASTARPFLVAELPLGSNVTFHVVCWDLAS
jgi:hypothetical protein